jgi:hypothetical protein
LSCSSFKPLLWKITFAAASCFENIPRLRPSLVERLLSELAPTNKKSRHNGRRQRRKPWCSCRRLFRPLQESQRLGVVQHTASAVDDLQLPKHCDRNAGTLRTQASSMYRSIRSLVSPPPSHPGVVDLYQDHPPIQRGEIIWVTAAARKPWSTPTLTEISFEDLPDELRLMALGLTLPEPRQGREVQAP